MSDVHTYVLHKKSRLQLLSWYKKKECLHNYILSAAAMSCSYIGAPKCWLFIHAAMCKYFTVFIALDVWNCLGITEQFRYVRIKEGQAGFFCDLASPTRPFRKYKTGYFSSAIFLSLSLSGLFKKWQKSSKVLIGCSLYLISRLPFKNTIITYSLDNNIFCDFLCL